MRSVMKIKLAKPELLNITNTDGETFTGGSQEWYEDKWHKKSGCGPVAASNLIWYMMRKKGIEQDYPELIHEMYGWKQVCLAVHWCIYIIQPNPGIRSGVSNSVLACCSFAVLGLFCFRSL